MRSLIAKHIQRLSSKRVHQIEIRVQDPISPTAIPTRVHQIWIGHNIPAYAYKYYNTRYNIQNIKSFTHPVMRKGPKSIGESHSAASLAMWPSIVPPREKTATQLLSQGLWGSLTKIIRSPCLTHPTGRRTWFHGTDKKKCKETISCHSLWLH